MEESLKSNIRTAISKTGFSLEYYIVDILKKHGWQIISNRYYIDDVKGIEREIDIIAYKRLYIKNLRIEYFTTLIISCKKSETNKWCFLTRGKDNNLDIDWEPFHFSTTDKILSYMARYYKSEVIESYDDKIKELYNFPEMIFAYQQLIKTNHDRDKERFGGEWMIKGNDDIYNSIITTIKALNAEKKIRSDYHKLYNNRFYNFQLLSIFEGDMIKVHFENEEEQIISEIQSIKYLNRHIVNNIDDFYIVNFINKDIFEEKLIAFDMLHETNITLLERLQEKFYNNIIKDSDKVTLIWKDFEKEILWRIKSLLSRVINDTDYDNLELDFSYDEYEDVFEISIIPSLPDSKLYMLLNADEVLLEETKEALKKIFKYEGKFIYKDVIFPYSYRKDK